MIAIKENKLKIVVSIVSVVVLLVICMLVFRNGSGASFAFINIAMVIGICSGIISKKKGKGGQTKPPMDESAKLVNVIKATKQEEHSHDRLSGFNEEEHSSDDHWKMQLDTFLKSGLITKEQYHEMLQNHKNDYTNTLTEE